jgi:autophagy-related protein 2
MKLQAFEAVVPSERTRVSLKITEGSIVAHASGHPGALVVHIGDTSFSTEIVGEAPDSTFHLSTPNLSVLLIDNLQDRPEGRESEKLRPVESRGVKNWMVCYLIISMGD